MASRAWPEAAPYDPAGGRDGKACPARLEARDWRDVECNAAFLTAWADLAKHASEPNPFNEQWALLPALTAHDSAGRCELLSLDSDGELHGLMPIARRGLYYRYPLPHLQNWMHGNAFCGMPLVRTGHERQFWQALFDWADRRAGTALFLHLTHLDEGGPLFAALCDVTNSQRRAAAVVHREERALLHSQLSPQDYLDASMSGKKRKELRRQHRRLAEEGKLEFARQIDASGLGPWTDEFLLLEKAGWKGSNGSALACSSDTDAMFRATLAGAAEAGRLERLRLSLDGKPIAMLANFITPPGAFSYKTAYDEDYARFSPGVLLQRENLDLLDNPAIDWCDSCASADHPMIDRIWREKRAMVRVSIAIGGSARQALCRQILRREAGTELGGL